MKSEFALFVSQFAVVFLLGFQSQSVRDNHHVRAAYGSALIGAAQIVQWKIMPRATFTETLAWWLAGPIAIVLSMFVYSRFFGKKRS